jgi:hypothetical protein
VKQSSNKLLPPGLATIGSGRIREVKKAAIDNERHVPKRHDPNAFNNAVSELFL